MMNSIIIIIIIMTLTYSLIKMTKFMYNTLDVVP